MLHHLSISNYALIDSLDIDFAPGFSVITGETGAGKSIILGALGLLLGQRADTKAIKAGAAKCIVEGTFLVEGYGLEAFFEESDIDFDGTECIVRREITAAGKSRAFINDTPAPLAKLKELGGSIIDIHSQHQNFLMGREGFLLDMLDAVAGDAPLRRQYAEAYAAWHQARTELNAFRETLRRDTGEADFLRHQLDQLEQAQLQPDEQDGLEQEAQVLGHAEEIKQGLYQAQSLLDSAEESLPATLRLGESLLTGVADMYPDAAALADRLASCRIELEDIVAELGRAVDQMELDPARLDYVNDRLNLIYQLQERHHVHSVGELLAIASDLAQKLERLDDADHYLAQQEEHVSQLHAALLELGAQLTSTRQQAAKTFAQQVSQTVQLLGMPHARLHFELAGRDEPAPSGMDRATLLFSANKNVPEQDASLIASGGEIARLMLAIKSHLAAHLHMPTIVFDEIDTGVSGIMAEKMGRVMQEMASRCQVVCITHLPQIAALGAEHYLVYKTEGEQATASHIVRLDAKRRVDEVARMLSGSQLTEAAINNAKALLAHGQNDQP